MLRLILHGWVHIVSKWLGIWKIGITRSIRISRINARISVKIDAVCRMKALGNCGLCPKLNGRSSRSRIISKNWSFFWLLFDFRPFLTDPAMIKEVPSTVFCKFPITFESTWTSWIDQDQRFPQLNMNQDPLHFASFGSLSSLASKLCIARKVWVNSCLLSSNCGGVRQCTRPWLWSANWSHSSLDVFDLFLAPVGRNDARATVFRPL